VFVRPSHHSAAARRCGWFAAVGPAAKRYRLLHGRRSAANASSITLLADVEDLLYFIQDVRTALLSR